MRAKEGFGGFFFVFVSVPYVSVANATLLMNTRPLFVPFLLLIFFKKPINHLLWFGIIPGFLGLILVLRPGNHLFEWINTVPLLEGLSVVMILIVTRQHHHHGEASLRILFYLFLFVSLVTPFFAIHLWKTPALKDLFLLLGTAIFGFFGQSMVTIAMRLAQPQNLAPLCYSSDVFALLFDWQIWHSIPSSLSIFGIALVILGRVLAIILAVKTLKKIQTSTPN